RRQRQNLHLLLTPCKWPLEHPAFICPIHTASDILSTEITNFTFCLTPELMPEKCKLPKLQGSCRLPLTRYYYNFETRKCMSFFYGGCKGNENVFDTKEECMAECESEDKGKTFTSSRVPANGL
uniref:BPTI/Kunitz inhibitor domain-containing protein n=1 Tax=Salvator merianae TaxID=96440 RepID=A0A8D0BQI0_SALMN